MTDTIVYGGPVTKSDGTVIELPEQEFSIEDTFEPDPSVGIFGEPGALVAVPLACDPEGVVYISARDYDEYRGIPDPDYEDIF